MKTTTVHVSLEEHSKLAPTNHRKSHSRIQRALREVPPRRWSGAHRRQRPHHEPPRGTRSGSKRSGDHGHTKPCRAGRSRNPGIARASAKDPAAGEKKAPHQTQRAPGREQIPRQRSTPQEPRIECRSAYARPRAPGQRDNHRTAATARRRGRDPRRAAKSETTPTPVRSQTARWRAQTARDRRRSTRDEAPEAARPRKPQTPRATLERRPESRQGPIRSDREFQEGP